MFYYDLHQKVDSSSIDEIFYNSERYEMVVKFVNGNYAGYKGVGKSVYDKFVNASSVGQHYNWFVKTYFSGFRVDGVAPKAPAEQVSEPAVAPKENGAKFMVVAEITGGATLDVYATDLTDALRVAEEQINKAFSGDVKVTFKGVNLV
jgi:hypothetical protein